MKIFLACLIILLTSCTSKPTPTPTSVPSGEGSIIHGQTWPQTADQCQAQPTLAWCK